MILLSLYVIKTAPSQKPLAISKWVTKSQSGDK